MTPQHSSETFPVLGNLDSGTSCVYPTVSNWKNLRTSQRRRPRYKSSHLCMSCNLRPHRRGSDPNLDCLQISHGLRSFTSGTSPHKNVSASSHGRLPSFWTLYCSGILLLIQPIELLYRRTHLRQTYLEGLPQCHEVAKSAYPFSILTSMPDATCCISVRRRCLRSATPHPFLPGTPIP